MNINFNPQIFRKDYPAILAKNAHLASLAGIVLKYLSAGYSAGQVLARNSVTGIYEKYVDGSASGIGDAACILLDDVPSTVFASSGDTAVTRGIFAGEVFEAKLTDLDAAAKVDLKGRSYTDASGITVFKF